VRVWTVVHGQLITVARQPLLLTMPSLASTQDSHLETETSPSVGEDGASVSEADCPPVEVGPDDDLGQTSAAIAAAGLSASRDTLVERAKPAKTASRSVKNLVERCGRNLRSVSESNLVLKERRAVKFSRKSCGRQSLPQVTMHTGSSHFSLSPLSDFPLSPPLFLRLCVSISLCLSLSLSL
jgi:hypothetical protein